jgi:hypothetical protein
MRRERIIEMRALWRASRWEVVDMTAAKRLLIEGSVNSGFESVREAFIENFTRRGELGVGAENSSG